MSLYEETLQEAKVLIQNNKKLKKFYDKQLLKGWGEEEALLNTYDEWFYHQHIYKINNE